MKKWLLTPSISPLVLFLALLFELLIINPMMSTIVRDFFQ